MGVTSSLPLSSIVSIKIEIGNWDQLISFSSSLGSQPSILMGNLNVIKHVSETNCPSDLKVLLIFKIACIK